MVLFADAQGPQYISCGKLGPNDRIELSFSSVQVGPNEVSLMVARNRKTNVSWETNVEKRDQPRICPVSGKRMYANEREANATAAHRMTEGKTAPAQLRISKCLYCGAWHLTSTQA